MTKGKSATPAVVLLAALLILGMPVTAAEVINTYVPIDSITFNPCSNEDVHLTGTAHMTTSITANDNRHNFHAHANFHVEGIGLTSGDSYFSNSTGMASENVELYNDEIGEASLLLHTRLIGKGNVPNANAFILTHITVTPNGDTTAYILDARLLCN